MNHVFFALFRTKSEAQAAVSELAATESPETHCTVVVHDRQVAKGGDPFVETHASEALIKGLAMGTVLGALAGVALTLMGVTSSGMFATAMVTAALGAMFGGLGGALTGAANPDHALERLWRAHRAGSVMVTVDAPGLTGEEHAQDIFRRHGARLASKPIV